MNSPITCLWFYNSVGAESPRPLNDTNSLTQIRITSLIQSKQQIQLLLQHNKLSIFFIEFLTNLCLFNTPASYTPGSAMFSITYTTISPTESVSIYTVCIVYYMEHLLSNIIIYVVMYEVLYICIALDSYKSLSSLSSYHRSRNYVIAYYI